MLNRMLRSGICLLVALGGCQHMTASQRHHPFDGDDVARALNARFDDTRAACPGNKAAYACSGVIVRVTNSTDFWNPRQGDERFVVSFSYLRHDVGMRSLFGEAGSGYALLAADSWGTPGHQLLTIRCAFAFNGYTEGRGPYGCGPHNTYPVESGPCLDQGIVTVDAFVQHYTAAAPPNDPAGFLKRGRHQCSFGTDAFSFELSILGRKGGSVETQFGWNNELVIDDWPVDAPSQFPVEAIFYYGGDSDKASARAMRDAYLGATGHALPIVYLTADENSPPFSYREGDQ